jgi:hypothetical protein
MFFFLFLIIHIIIKIDFSHILIICMIEILFFMMYNICLNIGLNILLFVTYRVTHYI